MKWYVKSRDGERGERKSRPLGRSKVTRFVSATAGKRQQTWPYRCHTNKQ